MLISLCESPVSRPCLPRPYWFGRQPTSNVSQYREVEKSCQSHKWHQLHLLMPEEAGVTTTRDLFCLSCLSLLRCPILVPLDSSFFVWMILTFEEFLDAVQLLAFYHTWLSSPRGHSLPLGHEDFSLVRGFEENLAGFLALPGEMWAFRHGAVCPSSPRGVHSRRIGSWWWWWWQGRVQWQRSGPRRKVPTKGSLPW